jgi:hypothetical protein
MGGMGMGGMGMGGGFSNAPPAAPAANKTKYLCLENLVKE